MPTSLPCPTIANTLRLPCRARALFCIASGDVSDARAWAKSTGLPLLALGEGSNVVLPPVLEAGVVRVTDKSMTILRDSPRDVSLRIGAGLAWHDLVSLTVKQGLYGLENLALIPGLVGAAPVQNIGAYGREFEEFVEGVHGVDLRTGRAQTLMADECEFSYRGSVFKTRLRDQFLITAVDITLSRVPSVNASYPALQERLSDQALTPEAVFDAVVSLRTERLPNPASTPNAGSFFKNPLVSQEILNTLKRSEPDMPIYPLDNNRSKLSAAWLIDRAGLRGQVLGTAAVSKRHALVLVTTGAALQSDVLALAERVQATVRQRFGVDLEPEPRIYV